MSLLPSVIPSPTQGVWYLGPLPIRAYALCILLGIVVAAWLGEKRWAERGGRPGLVLDIAAWAVPFGIVGGRLYHVITSWQPYFGPGGQPMNAFLIWNGGLGIWGAVALGTVGGWIACRRAGVRAPTMADALAPGIVIAQGIGRLGNWFNNELHGGPTDKPWGLRIYEWDQSAGHAVAGPDGKPVVLGVFQPTFGYELIWDFGVAGVLIWADRRFRLGHGRVFALYVLLYTLGRGWIEALRVDPANTILGLRLNLWTSLLVGLGALAYLVVSTRLLPGREASVLRSPATEKAGTENDGTENDGTENDGTQSTTVRNTAEGGGSGSEPGSPAADVPPDDAVDGTRTSDAQQSIHDAEYLRDDAQQESARPPGTAG